MKPVVGDEGDDGDAEAEGGGDEGFANPASDLFHGEFGATDAGETAHDTGDGAEKAEERGEGDDGVHGGEESSGAFDFDASGGLERALEAGVAVGDSGADDAEDGVFGVFAEFECVGGVATFEGGEDGVEEVWVAVAGELEPPPGAFDDDGDGEESDDGDGPHDGATFEEEFDEGVSEGRHGEGHLRTNLMGTMKRRVSPEGQRQLRRMWSRAAVSRRVCPLDESMATAVGTPLASTVTRSLTVPSRRAERAAEG